MGKEIFYKIHSKSFGDTLAATPTIRKLYRAYNCKVNVITHNKHIFAGNPYIERLLSFQEYDELVILDSEFEILESFVDAGKRNDRGVERKFASVDLRNTHSYDLGFELLPEEMSYDYYPQKENKWLDLPDGFVVLHVTSNWPNRTWSYERWNEVVKWLKEQGIFTITIGLDHYETLHSSVSNERLLKKCPVFKDLYGMDLTNKIDLDDMRYIFEKASILVTPDTGPMHLASTTDVHIIQIGSAQHWKFRAPYRNGTQDYKYTFIGGTCKIFCNGDLKYAVKEWGTINSVHPLGDCPEKKETFECHPTSVQVIHEIQKILGK